MKKSHKVRKKFSRNLRHMMKKSGINQAELSDLSGLTEASVSMLMNGQRSPALETIVKIRKALPFKYDEIFRGLSNEKDNALSKRN